MNNRTSTKTIMSKLKTGKGITLIALIVTIVVMLLLAAISISMLTGENGILNQANRVKKQSVYGQADDEVRLATTAVKMRYASEGKAFTISHELENDIQKELRAYAEDAIAYVEDDYICAETRGFKFKVDADSNVSKIEEEIVEGDPNLWVVENGVIVGYNGNFDTDLQNETLVIPNYVNGEKVEKIGDDLFASKIQEPLQVKLKISSGIKEIGATVFPGCTGLIGELKLPSTIEKIGNQAFVGRGFTGDLILPKRLKSLGGSTFAASKFTGNLYIPESLLEGGAWDFHNCSFTGTLTIAMKDIPDNMFYESGVQFTRLVLEDTVKTIGQQAFSGLSTLAGELKLPNSLEKIGYAAFYNTGFTGDLILPNGLKSLGGSTFSNSKFDGNLYIPESLETFGGGDFCCSFTGTLTVAMKDIPNSGQTGLLSGVTCTKLVLEDTVKTIAVTAFSGCTTLKGELIIPEGVTSIGSSAFSGCYGLDKVYIPNTVTYMGEDAFKIGVAGKRTEIYVDLDYRPNGWDYNWTNYRYWYVNAHIEPAPIDYNSLYVCWRGWGLNNQHGYYSYWIRN